MDSRLWHKTALDLCRGIWYGLALLPPQGIRTFNFERFEGLCRQREHVKILSKTPGGSYQVAQCAEGMPNVGSDA
jgi:hypothetical protein